MYKIIINFDKNSYKFIKKCNKTKLKPTKIANKVNQ